MGFEVDVAVRLGTRRIHARFVGGTGVTALFGPSGAGKTTVLNMIAGLVKPDEGRILFGGRTLFDSTGRINVAPERRRLGYVFQDARLFPHRNVAANLLYGHRLAPAEARWMEPEEAVKFLGIAALLDRKPGALSGGEAQRVAIGRALLSGAQSLLMDEPLSSLDEGRREEILEVVDRIVTELRLPVLYVTHDRREIERLGARMVTLSTD